MRSDGALGSVAWNRKHWDRAEWEQYGNGWTFHANACRQPYESWKDSVVTTFLDPYLHDADDVVEIAPGHGRWTEYMVGRTGSLTLADVTASCIDVCRERFGQYDNIRYFVNDGRSLPGGNASADLIWSFGSFVHIDPRDTNAYLAEFARVLKPGGRFVIHHSGWPDWTLRLVPFTRRAGRPGRVVQHRIAHGFWKPGGDRVAMSSERFSKLARSHGLRVDHQVRQWGPRNEFSLAFNDVITIGTR
jgi:ubiquinone/menaquinone biosynthesis C-methylase UbiE